MTIYFKPKRFVTKNVPSLMLSCLLIFIFSCSDDKTKTNGSGQPYDPNTPVKLETFYPDSGGMATKMIIKGTNFGTDPEEMVDSRTTGENDPGKIKNIYPFLTKFFCRDTFYLYK